MGQIAWNKKNRIEKTCKLCDKSFSVRPSAVNRLYCSSKCGYEARKGKYTGEEHPNWTGGSIEWAKQKVKIRDDYTCQICGLREMGLMDVDHIKPKAIFPELRTSLENLITLCPNCHRRKTIRDKKTLPFKNNTRVGVREEAD